MRQQINFYPLIPRKKGFYLTPKRVIFSYAVFAAILVFFHLHAMNIKQDLEKAVAKSNEEAAVMQAKLNDLLKKYPTSDPAELKKLVNTLQVDYESKGAAIDLLLSYANYAASLLGLAQTTVQGVWYTEIYFKRGDFNIELTGYALQPVFISKLLNNLAKPSVFKPLVFNIKQISDEKPPALFYIRSKRVFT